MTHVSFQNINGYIDDIRYCVANFDIELGNYNMFTPSQLKMKGDNTNKIYLKGNKVPDGIDLIFTEKAKNCNVFIDDGVTAKSSKISLKNDNNFLYLGKVRISGEILLG
ncbi:hypothetical protein [Escherichia coli]|uniref:hypothetical protein n=1 Tax=Escherichia coli TaxID=562 RepID=UPI00201EE368|nr:hypothetical protein [Escherichia coli]